MQIMMYHCMLVHVIREKSNLGHFPLEGGGGRGEGVPPHRHNGGAGDTVVTDEVGLETAIGIRLYCECP